MKRTKDNEMSHDSTKSDAGAKAEKLSRREFAKTSVAAGAVAATIPGVLQAAQQSSDPSAATPESPKWECVFLPPGCSISHAVPQFQLLFQRRPRPLRFGFVENRLAHRWSIPSSCQTWVCPRRGVEDLFRLRVSPGGDVAR